MAEVSIWIGYLNMHKAVGYPINLETSGMHLKSGFLSGMIGLEILYGSCLDLGLSAAPCFLQLHRRSMLVISMFLAHVAFDEFRIAESLVVLGV